MVFTDSCQIRPDGTRIFFYKGKKKRKKKSKGINDEIGVVMYVPVCDE